MRSILLLVVVLASGCELFFDDGGKRPPECLDTPAAEDTSADVAPAPLRNPETLTCESFGGGGCNPDCGPCPAQTDLAPIPSWPVCGTACETLAETECAARSECRVVKDARCMIGSQICITDFMGCFPVDNAPDPTIDCFAARDGWTCSRSNACTALHDTAASQCQGDQCARPFGLCVPEGKSPGNCQSPITCDALPPTCPTGTTPGRANSCWTGACIPTSLCEAGPA